MALFHSFLWLEMLLLGNIKGGTAFWLKEKNGMSNRFRHDLVSGAHGTEVSRDRPWEASGPFVFYFLWVSGRGIPFCRYVFRPLSVKALGPHFLTCEAGKRGADTSSVSPSPRGLVVSQKGSMSLREAAHQWVEPGLRSHPCSAGLLLRLSQPLCLTSPRGSRGTCP